MVDAVVLTKDQLFDRLAVLESTAVLDAHTTAHNEIVAHDASLRAALDAAEKENERLTKLITLDGLVTDWEVSELQSALTRDDLDSLGVRLARRVVEAKNRTNEIGLQLTAALRERDEAMMLADAAREALGAKLEKRTRERDEAMKGCENKNLELDAAFAREDEAVKRAEKALHLVDAALSGRDEARRMYCYAKSRACPHVVAAETWPADADHLFPTDGEVKP